MNPPKNPLVDSFVLFPMSLVMPFINTPEFSRALNIFMIFSIIFHLVLPPNADFVLTRGTRKGKYLHLKIYQRCVKQEQLVEEKYIAIL